MIRNKEATKLPCRNSFALFFIRCLGDKWHSVFDPRSQMQPCPTAFSPHRSRPLSASSPPDCRRDASQTQPLGSPQGTEKWWGTSVEQVGLVKTSVQSQEGFNFLFTKIIQLRNSIQTNIVTLPGSFQSGTQQNSCPSTLDCSSRSCQEPCSSSPTSSREL